MHENIAFIPNGALLDVGDNFEDRSVVDYDQMQSIILL